MFVQTTNQTMAAYMVMTADILDGQLKTTSRFMKEKNYGLAAKVLNDIIKSIRCAHIVQCNKYVLDSTIDGCYRALLDIAFKRYHGAQHRVYIMQNSLPL